MSCTKRGRWERGEENEMMPKEEVTEALVCEREYVRDGEWRWRLCKGVCMCWACGMCLVLERWVARLGKSFPLAGVDAAPQQRWEEANVNSHVMPSIG